MKRKRTFTLVVLFLFNLLSAQARGERTIGVLMWSEEPRYIETQQGIMEQLAKEGFREPAVRFIAPVKSVAVLYTPKEKNSELQLKELQGLQDDFQVKVVPVPLATTDDVTLLLPEVLRSVDAVYLSGSLVVVSAVSTIAEMAIRAKVMTVTHLIDLVEQGALLGVCADYRALGRLAGKKAVKVLKGARPSSIPIETQKKPDTVLNMRTVKAGEFKIPRSFMKSVTKVVE